MSKSAVPYLYGAEETIPIEQLHPFANHPFHVRHDLEMKELMNEMACLRILQGAFLMCDNHTRLSVFLCCRTLSARQLSLTAPNPYFPGAYLYAMSIYHCT